MAIQDYNFKISHGKGRKNCTAHTLNRLQNQQIADQPELIMTYILIEYKALIDKLNFQDISKHQNLDSNLFNIIQALNTNTDTNKNSKLNNTYKLQPRNSPQMSGPTLLIVVPENLLTRLKWECHFYYLHRGAKKCCYILKEKVYLKIWAAA